MLRTSYCLSFSFFSCFSSGTRRSLAEKGYAIDIEYSVPVQPVRTYKDGLPTLSTMAGGDFTYQPAMVGYPSNPPPNMYATTTALGGVTTNYSNLPMGTRHSYGVAKPKAAFNEYDYY